MGTLLMKFASCHNPAPKILRPHLDFLTIYVCVHCTPSRKHSNCIIYVYIYIYIHTYMHCVCVCVRERERERERARERDSRTE